MGDTVQRLAEKLGRTTAPTLTSPGPSPPSARSPFLAEADSHEARLVGPFRLHGNRAERPPAPLRTRLRQSRLRSLDSRYSSASTTGDLEGRDSPKPNVSGGGERGGIRRDDVTRTVMFSAR